MGNPQATQLLYTGSGLDESANSLTYARPYYNQSMSMICAFCGKGQHHRSKCSANKATCSNCQRRGHFHSVCQSKPQSQHYDQPQQFNHPQQLNHPQQYQPQQYQHRFSAAIATQFETYAPTLATIRNKSESKVYIPIKVNGITTTALIDTGSTEVHSIASHPRE